MDYYNKEIIACYVPLLLVQWFIEYSTNKSGNDISYTVSYHTICHMMRSDVWYEMIYDR